MNPQIVKGVEITDNIELMVEVDKNDEVNGGEDHTKALKSEQYQKVLSVMKDLDQLEKSVGTWDPQNNFHNIYQKINSLEDQFEEFNGTQSDGHSQMRGSGMVPETPSGSHKAKSLLSKAKEFNKELQVLSQKFNQIEDVAYDKQKVDMVFNMTEKAIEQSSHLSIIIERLKVLERINKESPNIEIKMQNIVKNAAKRIPDELLAERKNIDEVRNQLIQAATELDQVI